MTNVFTELQANNYIKEKEFKKAISLFLGEKLLEGYYLEDRNVISSEYKRIFVLQNDNNERFGFGVKVVNYDVTIQWGKLKNRGLFVFEDKKNSVVATFKAIDDKNEKVYFDVEKFKNIEKKRNNRLENKCFVNYNHIFKAKNLHIKGIKRERDIEVERVSDWVHNNLKYKIYKNGKVYKEVKFPWQYNLAHLY